MVRLIANLCVVIVVACIATLCGCGASMASQEQCLLRADAYKVELAHESCHGLRWRDCPHRNAINRLYAEEQNKCRAQ